MLARSVAILTGALSLFAVAAHATTITAYDALGTSAQSNLVDATISAFTQAHPAAADCIAAYRAPAAGGAAARLGDDVQALVERSRAVAPDSFEVEALVEGLLMVECGIAPE